MAVWLGDGLTRSSGFMKGKGVRARTPRVATPAMSTVPAYCTGYGGWPRPRCSAGMEKRPRLDRASDPDTSSVMAPNGGDDPAEGEGDLACISGGRGIESTGRHTRTGLATRWPVIHYGREMNCRILLFGLLASVVMPPRMGGSRCPLCRNT